MVDWERVEELHEKGWEWEKIAADPRVGFHPGQGISHAGPALRRLYYRRKSREGRRPAPVVAAKRVDPDVDKRWSLARIGFLFLPLTAIWLVIAYFAPSPIGLLLPAVPWVALAVAISVFVLAFGLLRSTHRWTRVFRGTVILGIVIGLVFVGMIGLSAALFGCPFLPPASSLASQPGPGWTSAPSYVPAWQQGGQPVLYFYGATWCPYCSASSWPIWKALTEFQSGFNGQITGIPGTQFGYSSPSDTSPQTPEVWLAPLQVASSSMAFIAIEDTSGTDGNFPGTANCNQQAYVTAYSGSAIPFVVINGQYVHGGSSLIDPTSLSTWAGGASGGAPQVATNVLQESGAPWSAVSAQAGWVTAFLVKASGLTVSQLASTYTGPYQWTAGMQSLVNGDLAQIA